MQGIMEMAPAADLAAPDFAVADSAPAPCGAASQICCAGYQCGAGLVCIGASCIAAIQPAACPDKATPAVFIGETAPPANLAPWARARVTVTFANCSGAPWNAAVVNSPDGFKLGTQAPMDN